MYSHIYGTKNQNIRPQIDSYTNSLPKEQRQFKRERTDFSLNGPGTLGPANVKEMNPGLDLTSFTKFNSE